MLPTTYKNKIGGAWSYPLGAEAISRALEGTLYGPRLEISFHQFRNTAKEMNTVASVEYMPVMRGRLPDYPMFRGPQWSFRVRAVRRESVRQTRDLMRTTGLAAFAAWLDTPRTPTWLATRHSITATFMADMAGLAFSED